jgi:predicted extracellular nuclease
LRSKLRRRALVASLATAALVPLVASVESAGAAPTELFFSEYVEGSSNNKALEIYNGTGSAVDLAAGNYSVQMCFNGSAACALTINLTGVVAPGDVFVLAQSSASPTILAQADQTNGSGWFNGDDAVVLLKGAFVVDSMGQRGFDPGTEWGTGLTSTADNTLRRKFAVESGDTNTLDVFDPAVEWNGFATDDFSGLGFHSGDEPPSVTSTTPANGAAGVAVDANVSVTFSESVAPSGSWYTISCGTSGAHAATASGGPQTFTLDPSTDFAANESCTVTIAGSLVSDTDAVDPPDAMSADYSFTFQTVAPATLIRAIQDSGHISPLNGELVSSVPGIVTAKLSNGFYLQDPNPDTDDATSEAILVFTATAPAAVAVADSVTVSGRVSEFRART